MSTIHRIKDNPSLKNLLKKAKGFETISTVVSFLEKYGINKDKLSDVLKQAPDLVKKTEELVNMPDRFNEHFSKSGWITYETLNFELMKNAVKLADAGRLEEASKLLVEHIDEKTLNISLTSMQAIEEYNLRYDLAQKAKEDYLAGRYHACIPVVLTIIDGIANDIEQKGFFAQGVDLTAWDSIAAHSTGLQEICKLFNETRKKTTTKTITVPYRHGILHGRDLGYANKIVAAKTWTALFAIRDWALAIKHGKKYPKEPEPSLFDLLKSLAETQKKKKKLKTWKPRDLIPGKDYPHQGLPEEYENSSPEQALAQYFQYWSKKNYGNMAGLINTFIDVPLSKQAGKVRENFQDKSLVDFKILRIVDEGAALSDIAVELKVKHDGNELIREMNIRVINADDNSSPVIRGEPGGRWLIMEQSLYTIYSII